MPTTVQATPFDTVPGDHSGMALPAHKAALERAGPDFLTRAFRAFGTLGPENRVSRIIACEPCEGGSTGDKAFLTVEYDRPEPGLDTALFVKFSRNFLDPLKDGKRGEMAAEVHFGQLSCHPDFPISVPRTYFADWHAGTGTGLLITSRVLFGEGAIEPQLPKSLDHLLPNRLEYYRAIFTALGRLVGAHKSGRLRAEIDTIFPFDREDALLQDPMPYDRAGLLAQIGRVEAFVNEAQHLFPPTVYNPAFFVRFRQEALRYLDHADDIKRFLHADERYVALCHWNANLDNAWFWRDGNGQMHCGLIDWGRVHQLNLAYAIWGALLVASRDLWVEHLDELLGLFSREIAAAGGSDLPVDELKLHLDLYAGIIGIAAVLVAPDRILHRMPQAKSADGPLDPAFDGCEQARNYLRVLSNFLELWERRDFGTNLDLMLQRLGG